MATDISVAFMLRVFPVIFRGKIDNFAHIIVVCAHTIVARACIFKTKVVSLHAFCVIITKKISHDILIN